MLSRLPPPPQFLLPPPPMPPPEISDWKIVSQLTCSSIGEEYRRTAAISPLILFTSASVIAAILLFTFTLICFLSSRKQKQSWKNSNPKPPESMNDLSTCSNRSYETVSSDHTGIYVESVDTSATTCSINTVGVVHLECYHQHVLQSTPYYHILSIPDVVPN